MLDLVLTSTESVLFLFIYFFKHFVLRSQNFVLVFFMCLRLSSNQEFIANISDPVTVICSIL